VNTLGENEGLEDAKNIGDKKRKRKERKKRVVWNTRTTNLKHRRNKP